MRQLADNLDESKVFTRVLISGRQEGQSRRHLLDGSRERKGDVMMKAVVRVMWTPEILESGKGREIDSPLELSERTHSC